MTGYQCERQLLSPVVVFHMLGLMFMMLFVVGGALYLLVSARGRKCGDRPGNDFL